MSTTRTIMKSLFATIASLLVLTVAITAEAQPFAYITNQSANSVSVFDTATNTVTVTLPVGTGPRSVAVNPAGTKVYAANITSNDVSVIDTTSNTVVATVPVGINPRGLAVDPTGKRVYVSSSTNATVSVIDTALNSVVATVPVGITPRGVAINPAGTRVYVPNSGSNNVSVIDTATNTVIATVPVGTNPFAVAVNAAGTRVYVSNQNTNNVSVIDIATNTMVATVPVGTVPQGIALNPSGTRAYVANASSNNVSVVDTGTNTVIATVVAGTFPFGIGVHPAGSRVYVTNSSSNNISVIETVTNTVLTTVAVAVTPNALAVGPATVPGAPTSASATSSSSGQATISFTPPVSDGGSAITSYKVTSSTGGNFASGAASPITVSGLTNGTAYTFTVNATNAVGPGPASVASNGVTPSAIRILPSSLTFPTTAQGTFSLPQSVTVSNLGASVVTLGAPTAGGPEFILFATTCGTTLASMASCTVDLKLGPSLTSSPGPTSGLVSISSSSGSASAGLVGAIAVYSASTSPASVTFPNTPVLTNSASQTVTFTNSSSGTINISAVDFTGTDIADFQIVSSTCGGIVASMSTCSAVVRFSPQTLGAKSANLRFNSGGTSTAASLSGNSITAVPFIISATSANGVSGSPFFYMIVATNSPTSFGATGLPVPLTVNTATGVISGTPSATGTFPATITATNAGGTGSQGLTITISAATVAPTITSAPPPGGTVGGAYSSAFTASGTTPISWTIITGSLPAGLTLNATSGLLSGTPTTAGTFGFTVQAANGTPPNASQNVTIVIAPARPPTVTLSLSNTTTTPGSSVGLVLNITNPDSGALTAGSFTFVYPTGIVTATPSSLINSCGGTITSAPGSTTLVASGLALGPNGSCAIGVSVQSAVAGSYVFNFPAGGFSASTGVNATASSVTLTVAALAAPTITNALVPTSITVGGTTVGTITISNSNAVPLTANPFTFNFAPGLVNAASPNASSTCSGANITATPGAGSYQQTTSFVIPASGSCSFSSTITANTPGTYTGTIPVGLIVTTAGSSTASNSVTLIVTAAPSPAVTLSPQSVSFGSRTVNTTSAPMAVTLTNSGAASLVISSITGSGDFGFTSTCPINKPPLAASGSCVTNITFTPLTVGAISGGITIVSNAPGSPHAIGLSGTGAAIAVPGFSVAPPALGFGAQTVNTTSAAQSVIISNPGFANLIISSISVDAPFRRVALSAAAAVPECASSLAPGNSCQIDVVFAPVGTGDAVGSIYITDNATDNGPGGPHTVSLSGTGTPVPVPVISVNSPIAFGDQIINTTSNARSITIGNTGTATLNISAIVLTGTDAANFSVTGQSGCTSIAPAGRCTLNVSFTPTTTGAKTAQVNITSNAQNAAEVNTTVLTGNGVFGPRPIVNFTSTAVGFGNVIFGGATPNQIITLTNTGAQALAIPGILVTGDFVQTNNCSTSLAALASCTITILFTPLGQGPRFGEFILTTNTDTSPDRILLSGTGCRWFSQAKSRLFLTNCGR